MQLNLLNVSIHISNSVIYIIVEEQICPPRLERRNVRIYIGKEIVCYIVCDILAVFIDNMS
mgnify:CR=1 FL=1